MQIAATENHMQTWCQMELEHECLPMVDSVQRQVRLDRIRGQMVRRVPKMLRDLEEIDTPDRLGALLPVRQTRAFPLP